MWLHYRSRMKIEALVVMVLGMIWLTSPIRLSSGQTDGLLANNGRICWQKIYSCLEENVNQSKADPGFTTSPGFNMSDYICCPLFQESAQNDKSCFCYMDTYAKQNATGAGQVSTILTVCKLFDSLHALDTFCSSADTTSPLSGEAASPTQDNSPASPASASSSGGKKKTIIIAIAAASAIVLVLTAIALPVFCCRKRKRPQVTCDGTVKEDVPAHQHHQLDVVATVARDDGITPESLQYEFEVLKEATNNFSDNHKLGQGGFGAVYKGILKNGQEIAVKRLSMSSGQGDKEFKNEVAFVAKLQHRNLVKLMGFCLAKEERLLVYEFMRNKSLDYILFDPEKQKQLNWSMRYNVMKGVARGMLYLHEDSPIRIVHRDLKAANVLLDTEMNPKIADFGMARIFPIEQTYAEASRIVGTCGYMAPEYLMHGQISAKSDVYSFGVLVLEIVSGKRISTMIYQSGGENLLSWAWRCLRDRKVSEFMDLALRYSSYSEEEIVKCIHTGLLCVQEDSKERPTMEKIVHMFNSHSPVSALSMPRYPAFLFRGFTDQSTSSASVTWSTSEPSPLSQMLGNT